MKDLFDEFKMTHMNPLFDYLGELFNKEEEKLKRLEQDIKRGIMTELANCTTIEAVAEIEARDKAYFDSWGDLKVHAVSARKRIRGLFKVQVDAYGLEMLN